MYYIYPDEKNKKQLLSILNPIMEGLNNIKNSIDKDINAHNDELSIIQGLKDVLDSLLNEDQVYFTKASGINVLNNIIRYIYKMSPSIITEDEKIQAIQTFNILNLRTLQRREQLVNSSRQKQYEEEIDQNRNRLKEEYDNFFEEIESLKEQYVKDFTKLTEAQKNQIRTISADKQFDFEIISDEVIKQLETLINNINADFTADFYIRYTLLKQINDWDDLFQKTTEEQDLKYIIEQLESNIDLYYSYLEKQEISTYSDESLENKLIFLQDEDKVVVGINWINDDKHEYDASDYKDLSDGINKIITKPFEELKSTKVKNAGIPGVSEAKFRRLRHRNARIFFININNLVDSKFKYITPFGTCYVIINFGQKKNEFDIYKSLNIKKSTKIPRILIKFRDDLNNRLEEILKMNISEEEKSFRMIAVLQGLVISSNEVFEQSMPNAKGYQKEYANTKEYGGLKND